MVHRPFPPADDLQRELTTTCHLLEELGIGSLEENVKALDLLSELKETTQKKDLELRRYCKKDLKLGAASRTPESGQLWCLQRPGVQGSSEAGRGEWAKHLEVSPSPRVRSQAPTVERGALASPVLPHTSPESQHFRCPWVGPLMLETSPGVRAWGDLLGTCYRKYKYT